MHAELEHLWAEGEGKQHKSLTAEEVFADKPLNTENLSTNTALTLVHLQSFVTKLCPVNEMC